MLPPAAECGHQTRLAAGIQIAADHCTGLKLAVDARASWANGDSARITWEVVEQQALAAQYFLTNKRNDTGLAAACSSTTIRQRKPNADVSRLFNRVRT